MALLVLAANAVAAVLVGFASGVLALFPAAGEGCPKQGPCPRAQPAMDWTPVIAFGALAVGALVIAVALLRFGPRSVALAQTACAVILCLVAWSVAVTEWRDAHPQPVRLLEQCSRDVGTVRETLRAPERGCFEPSRGH
ncbi:DUF6234 family protein [Streptomyces sp. KLOTTS4A1]|uniref:DUF6234 family protein n=1 Tax=Streptomyces sp. KLOTTS4A1 TaxID=3390996 RepID=UPI0039F5F4A3